MRDVERLRDRMDLTLDDRQVVAIAVCGLLLLGGVFALGILLGRKLSGGQGALAVGDLATLDAQARRVEPAPPRLAVKPAAISAEPKAAERVEKAEPPRMTSVAPPPPQKTTIVAPPAMRPVQVAATPVALALTPPPRDLGEFTVQIGASQDRSEAGRLEARARGAGLKPYVLEANLGPRGLWYRVRVGAFRDRDAAGRFRSDVERELRLAAVVMPAR
jgi:DedD protein